MPVFDETVNLQQVDTRTGAAQAFRSLGERLGAFKAQQSQAIGQIVQKVDERVQIQRKSALDAYKQDVELELREGLAKIAAESPDDLVTYNEKANAFMSSVIESTDPSIRQDMGEFADRLGSSYRIDVQTRNINKDRAEFLDKTENTISASVADAKRLARKGDQDSMLLSAENMIRAYEHIDSAVDKGFYSAAEAEAKKLEINKEMAEETFLAKIDNAESLEAAFNELNSWETPKGWSPEEFDNVRGRAEAAIKDRANREAEDRLAADIEIDRAISNLEIEAKTGVSGMPTEKIISQADSFYSNGKIGRDKRTSIITAALNRSEKTSAQLLDDYTVQKRLEGDDSVVVTPQQIDAYYERHVNLEGLSPIQRNTFNADFISKTKQVPTMVKRQINNDLRTENPELIANAADMMDRIINIKGVEEQFSTQDLAYAENITNLMQSMPILEAIKIAQQNTDPRDENRVKAVEEELKEDKKGFWGSNAYEKVIDKEFDGYFSNPINNINQGKLTKDYESLYENFRKAGMSKDGAKDKALQYMRRNWGEFNGVTMKYPPQDFYAVAGSADYVQEEIEGLVKESFLYDQPIKDIQLLSDGDTARSASAGMPNYGVIVILEDGRIDTLPHRFVPDFDGQKQKVIDMNVKNIRNKEEATLRRAQEIKQKEFRSL